MPRLAAAVVGALAIAGVLGCDGTDAEAQATPPAKAPEATNVVGYDIRRLRPRDGERLAAMFDRMAARTEQDGKQVAVLFSADWCEPCRRLELEFGNEHPPEKIGGFRILEVKEEDWAGATRMDEFNTLRRRWYAPIDSYPVFIVLDREGRKVEEMKEAIERLQLAQIEPTVDNWFANIAQGHGPTASESPQAG